MCKKDNNLKGESMVDNWIWVLLGVAGVFIGIGVGFNLLETKIQTHINRYGAFYIDEQRYECKGVAK